MHQGQRNRSRTFPRSSSRSRFLWLFLSVSVAFLVCFTAPFARAGELSPTDFLLDSDHTKNATVSGGAATLTWTQSETAAVWFFVTWQGDAASFGGNVIPGRSDKTGGWAFMRSVNCKSDWENSCDATGGSWRYITLSLGDPSGGLLAVQATPIANSAANYAQLKGLNDTLDAVYGNTQSIRNESSDIRYYLSQIHYSDLPGMKQQLEDLKSSVDKLQQTQQEQAAADAPAQDNAKQQQEQTENLKQEGDSSKYDSDSQQEQSDLTGVMSSLKTALQADAKSCAVNLSDGNSRVNFGSVDFCAGTIPSAVQKVAVLALFSMAIALPVRAIRIIRDAQVSARDDAQSDKVEKHVEVTT